MSVKLVAIYDEPDDRSSFDAHYDKIHTPLAKAIPGLAELRVTRSNKKIMGSADVYLIAEMIFPDQAAFETAMSSNENKVAGADLANFAKGKVTLLVAEE